MYLSHVPLCTHPHLTTAKLHFFLLGLARPVSRRGKISRRAVLFGPNPLSGLGRPKSYLLYVQPDNPWITITRPINGNGRNISC